MICQYKHHVRVSIRNYNILNIHLKKKIRWPIGLPSDMCRRRQWHPTPVLLPGKSHGQRSLVGCSPWGHWESDTTERLHFHFSLSCIGEGNGNPLQCSCRERIPGMAEPGGLPSMGLHRVRHDWSDLAAAAAADMRWGGGAILDINQSSN